MIDLTVYPFRSQAPKEHQKALGVRSYHQEEHRLVPQGMKEHTGAADEGSFGGSGFFSDFFSGAGEAWRLPLPSLAQVWAQSCPLAPVSA